MMIDNCSKYNELFAAAKCVSVNPEIITPKIAAEYLEHNKDNFRKVKPAVVNNYAHDMSNNTWKLSWDCIAFDEDGNLLNGQHRLGGIVSSGKPQVCYIMRGCPKGLFFGDTGAKRTTNDYLRNSGADPVLYSSIGVGAINVMLKFMFTKRNKAPTTFDVQNLLEQMPNRDALVSIIQIARPGAPGVRTAAVVAAVYAAFSYTGDERVISFWNELVSGVGQSTVINLRDKLITKAYGTNGSQTQMAIVKIVQRVIKAYLDGEALSKLYIPPDIIYMLDSVIDLKVGDDDDGD